MADTQGLTEHGAAVDVNAPTHQVYGLFTHFNDFPKFMSFVKEVTNYDDQRSDSVDEAPPGALDPTSSNYLFHSGSAAAKGTTTSRQDETMGDRMSTADNTTETDRPILDQDIISGQYDNRSTTQGSVSDRDTY